MQNFLLIQQIDALLPQTQCGLCGHRDGCLPYAQSIAQGEEANKCVPGGQPVADSLAKLLNRIPLTAQPSHHDIQADGRPQRMKAIIREDECIGCTKCINACPVDAIIGRSKLMHTVLTDLCTGCELCIPSCPVDCIDLVPDHNPLPTESQRINEQNHLRQRYYAHIQREEQRQLKRRNPIVRSQINTSLFIEFSKHLQDAPIISNTQTTHSPLTQHKNSKITIELAKIRTQIKKLQKQLEIQPDTHKQQQLAMLIENLKNRQGLS